jgi:hypothetical protein
VKALPAWPDAQGITEGPIFQPIREGWKVRDHIAYATNKSQRRGVLLFLKTERHWACRRDNRLPFMVVCHGHRRSTGDAQLSERKNGAHGA